MDMQETRIPFLRSIHGKLLMAFLLLALVPLILVSAMAYMQAQMMLKQAAYDKLEAVRATRSDQTVRYFTERQSDTDVLVQKVALLSQEGFAKLAAVQEAKKNQLERYFARRWADVEVLTDSADVLGLYTELKAYHDEIKVEPTEPFLLGTEAYAAIIAPYEEFMADYVQVYGYYDIFLICSAHGHIMYTYARESDLGSNLSTGELKDSNLAGLWRRVATTGKPAIVDYAPYAPSGGAQAMFIGAPIHNGNGQMVGLVALQIPSVQINAIVQERAGMGDTVETYLIGQAGGATSYRSDRVVKAGNIGDPKSGDDANQALSGTSGQMFKMDGTGVLELSIYAPLQIPGLNWGIISTVAVEEVIAPKLKGEEEDFFAKYVAEHGYYDLFLIDPQGYVFYTIKHESDYQTSMVNGPYSDTNLGRLVRQVMESKQFGFADFELYAPSNDEPAAFIAQPVVYKGEIEVIVALQLPLEEIDSIMGVRAGMGETGETYLVGPDFRMRSNSLLSPETHSVVASFQGTVEANGVDTEASRRALAGESGVGLISDYRGRTVVSSWSPVNVLGANWAIIAELDADEAFARVTRTRNALLGIVVAVAVGVLVTTIWVARALARPIIHLTAVVRQVTSGDLEMQASVASRDETGQLARAFNNMTAQLRDLISGLEQEIAERVRAENELQKAHDELEERVKMRTRDLETTNKELESFAYSVSHDLRAPLRAIDGFSQALLEDYTDKLDAQGKDYLNRVRAGSQRMGVLIDDILKLSRLSRGDMHYESVDLSALATAISKELEASEPERKVEFVITPDLNIQGDAHLLRVALENLVGNAWKFTSKKERARIEFGVTEVEGERVFFVSDNGAGFDMAYADQLFGTFQRLHRATEFPGTGIGLAIVQRVLHRHGGRIWAESVIDQGATFYFVL